MESDNIGFLWDNENFSIEVYPSIFVEYEDKEKMTGMKYIISLKVDAVFPLTHCNKRLILKDAKFSLDTGCDCHIIDEEKLQ